jgi:succinate dehydrogenase/fumarate reductase cytochrome b subunit
MRVAHGICGAVAATYILFHLGNHFTALSGPAVHSEVMNMGRRIYRAPLLEPLLVAVMLFQIGSGLKLAWRRTEAPLGVISAVQVATGCYLAVFIAGHMNSVFVYARAYLGIQTDWNFAAGAPGGLLGDAWNIRLVPHYALGVAAVLIHLVCGARVVLIAHGAGRRSMNLVWVAGCLSAVVIAAMIVAAMCGLRI